MRANTAEPSSTAPLITRLKDVLHGLHQNGYPHVPNPPTCMKRASVALVLRIRPTYPHATSYDPQRRAATFQETLDNFFTQAWVQEGDPEVLLIKRAARQGDRWTGHIALPGGKRDPEDLDDRATSSRETREETGLEVDTEHCLYIGNLPERVITAAWGKKPLMVLCPYIYLLLRYDIPPLMLQPTEVHSAHWVPIRRFLSPFLRTSERCDVSDRFTLQRSHSAKALIRALVGQMVFSATRLKPSESVYSTSLYDFNSAEDRTMGFAASVTKLLGLGWLDIKGHPSGEERPLLLWGLTLGIMADFLELVDAEGAAKLWSWPTFSHWDIRSIIWVLTFKFRSQRLREFRAASDKPQSKDDPISQFAGLDTTSFASSVTRRTKASEAGLAGAHLLDGYFGLMRRAVVIALITRLGVGGLFTALLVYRYRRRRS